ncbi:MAG: NAD(P)H-hydrate dehydratase [Clostridia bacterium]|nr:NAD(P)H-hydrate dehydratase [Clostridia bacterium]
MPIGIDTVKISRMQHLVDIGLPDKIFTAYEREYILSKKNPNQTAAGIYAAKEAVLKALGTGITLPLHEVCINHLPQGNPDAALSGNALEAAMNMGIHEFELSITHDGEYATAAAYACVDTHMKYYRQALQKLCNAPDNAISTRQVMKLLPQRESATHKGSYGRVYVLAGSVGLTGAAIMACNAVLKCGAGLITLGCARELNTIFEISLREVMTKPLPSENGIINAQNTAEICADAANADVCLIGPGLGRSQSINQIIMNILSMEDTPCVIDADGLNAIADDISVLRGHKSELILTPHIGEFARLTGLSAEEILKDPCAAAADFAKEYRVTLVLKSHRTVIADPHGNVCVNLLGNPGMATGGTGDVLSGTITSFAAQGKGMDNAAVMGVYLHSLAADMASYDKGEYSLTPTDIVEYLPYAVKYTQKEMLPRCVPGQK